MFSLPIGAQNIAHRNIFRLGLLPTFYKTILFNILSLYRPVILESINTQYVNMIQLREHYIYCIDILTYVLSIDRL